MVLNWDSIFVAVCGSVAGRDGSTGKWISFV